MNITTITQGDQIVTEDAVSLLDIGSGPDSAARKFFPNAVITRMDIDTKNNPDILHDITVAFPDSAVNKFDIVYCSHILEHIDRPHLFATVDNLVSALKNHGELWVIVPSLEWAANEIQKDIPSPALQPVLWGGQNNEYQFHKVGFTLAALRGILMRAGLVIRQAYQGNFLVEMSGNTYLVKQNIVIAMRYDKE